MAAGCCCRGGCCRFQTFLVWIQMLLGLAITGFCAYLHVFVDVITLRDKPFWAGIPLLLAGLFGTSFIGSSKNQYGSSSACRFVFKVASVIMAVLAACTCMTSLVFVSLHIYRLFSYSLCRHVTNGCLCYSHVNQTDVGHLYAPVTDCHVLYCEIKIYMCSMGSLCFLAGLAAVSFLVTVWKAVYGATSPAPTHTAGGSVGAASSTALLSSTPHYRHGLTEVTP